MKENQCVLMVVFDKISGIYTSPMCFTNLACGVRYFDNAMKKSENPTDYELYLIGYYNAETAICDIQDLEFIKRGEVLYGKE